MNHRACTLSQVVGTLLQPRTCLHPNIAKFIVLAAPCTALLTAAYLGAGLQQQARLRVERGRLMRWQPEVGCIVQLRTLRKVAGHYHAKCKAQVHDLLDRSKAWVKSPDKRGPQV